MDRLNRTDGREGVGVSAEELMRLRCDSPRSITRARTSQEPEGVRAAAGWTVADGAATGSSPGTGPRRTAARPAAAGARCCSRAADCGEMGSLGAGPCIDCGQHEPGEAPQLAPTGDMTTDMD